MKLMNYKKNSIMLLMAFATNHANAQMDTLRVHPLDEIEIVATQSKVASNRLHIISTVTADEIQTLPVTTLNDLLDCLPGVDIRTRGSNGAQADISMRGGTFDQVLILLNGVNVTDPRTGHANLDLPIDLAMIDRIEVLQGTSMNLFGLSAFSGAINIITNSTERKQVKASVTGGDFGYFSPTIGVNYTKNRWKFTGSGSYNTSDGYMENTDYEYSNVFLQSSYGDSLWGNWNLQVGGQLKEFGANSFYSLKYPSQFEATKTLLSALQWQKRLGSFELEVLAYYRTHYDRFELFREGVTAFPTWYTTHNYHLTTSAGGNVKGSWFSRIGKTSVGIELRNEHIFSTVLGDPINIKPAIPFAPDSLFFTHEKNRLNLNYFAEQSFFIRNWSASLGISGNYNTLFHHNFAFGVNVGYSFAKNGTVFANVNRALRLPTFTDLYYKSATQLANPNLRPEESLTTEIGVQWTHQGLRTSLSAYYRMGQNLIDWVKTADEEKWRSVNHTRVDALGGEVKIGYSYGYWLKNIELNYSYCHLDKETGELLSKYALDYLEHKLTFNFEHGIYKGFGASWQLNYQIRQGSYIDKNGAVQSYQPFFLVDGRLFWQNNTLNLFLESSNLLNTTYYDYGGIAQPGRWLKAGISVNLDLK